MVVRLYYKRRVVAVVVDVRAADGIVSFIADHHYRGIFYTNILQASVSPMKYQSLFSTRGVVYHCGVSRIASLDG